MTSTSRLRSRPVIAALTGLVLALVVGALLITASPSTRTVSAEFARTVGLFEGSDVRVMGMRIGEVSKITPHGTAVTVEMTYDAQYRLPRDVRAVVVAPSVIADRFVQLTPGYVGGPVLASGAVIAEKDTRIPVELDTSLKVTTDLVTALGPDGANRNGALAAALNTVAKVLDGNGAPTRRALHELAAATDVIGAGAGQISSTVKNLAGVTGTLAQYDADVRTFNTRLESVSGSLAADSGELSSLLATLARSLGEVADFVRDNRRVLTSDVGRLAAVTGALVKERKALTEIVEIAPLAFTDLTETYDPQAQAVRTRANFGEIARVVDKVVCDTLSKQAGPQIAPLCAALKSVFDGLGIRGGLGAVPSVPTGVPAARPAKRDTSYAGLLGSLTAPLAGGLR
ncbi:MAG: MCE family protein [Marmoricola sp.]